MILNLRLGSKFNYKGVLYTVIHRYNIDWDDNTNSIEYLVKSKKGTSFLEVYRTSESVEYSMWGLKSKSSFIPSSDYVKQTKIHQSLKNHNDEFVFQAVTSGRFSFVCNSEYVRCIDYKSQKTGKLMSIEMWDGEVEYSIGEVIQLNEIKNIHSTISSKLRAYMNVGFSLLFGSF